LPPHSRPVIRRGKKSLACVEQSVVTGASSEARRCLPEVVETIKLGPTSEGRRAWTAVSASHTRAVVSIGILRVLGRSRPGNVVTRRVVFCALVLILRSGWVAGSTVVAAILVSASLTKATGEVISALLRVKCAMKVRVDLSK